MLTMVFKILCIFKPRLKLSSSEKVKELFFPMNEFSSTVFKGTFPQHICSTKSGDICLITS